MIFIKNYLGSWSLIVSSLRQTVRFLAPSVNWIRKPIEAAQKQAFM